MKCPLSEVLLYIYVCSLRLTCTGAGRTGGLGSPLIAYAIFDGEVTNVTHIEIQFVNDPTWPGKCCNNSVFLFFLLLLYEHWDRLN